MDDYQKIIASLRISYNREKAAQRDQTEKESWKVTLRQQFLSLLKQEGKTVLKEKSVLSVSPTANIAFIANRMLL